MRLVEIVAFLVLQFRLLLGLNFHLFTMVAARNVPWQHICVPENVTYRRRVGICKFVVFAETPGRCGPHTPIQILGEFPPLGLESTLYLGFSDLFFL